MRKTRIAIAVLSAVTALSMPVLADVTKEDLKKLAKAGISDDVILSYVKANAPLARLSPEDLIELKQAGASEKLLASVLAVPATSPSPAARQESGRMVAQQPVYTPATTYVYDATPYYYAPSTANYSSYPGYYYPRSYYYPSYSFSYGHWPSHHSYSSSGVHSGIHSSGHFSSHSGSHFSSHGSGHHGHH